MKIYFGHASLNDNPEDLFEHNGRYYYFEVDSDDEGNFTIADTCGRKVPFDTENIDSLINVLCYLRDYTKAKAFTGKYLGRALQNLASMYSLESARE